VGVGAQLITRVLALVGDSARGSPGRPGTGPSPAAPPWNQPGGVENVPPAGLGDGGRGMARLFRGVATRRTGAPGFQEGGELRSPGPTGAFAECAERLGDTRLATRSLSAPVLQV